MTFPATGTSKPVSLSTAWEFGRDRAAFVRRRAAQLSASAAGASTPAVDVLGFATEVADARVDLVRVSQLGGMGAYAQSQMNDPTLNAAAEFNAMIAAIDSAISAIISNFPKDASNRLLFLTFAADNSGRNTSSTFTAAQMAPVKTALDALVATISA
jgi:hypothetical protein